MKLLLKLLLVILPALALSGCDREASPAPAAAGRLATPTIDLGRYQVTLQPSDGAIERGKHFSLDLTVEASDGGAGAIEVVVDADMPAHRHGMNTKPELVATGENTYRVDGMLFHMAGDWVITVELARNGEVVRATFPVSIE